MTAEQQTAEQATGTEWTQEDIDEITIEATVMVYLSWDAENGRWYVASSVMDGLALDPHSTAWDKGPIYTGFGGYDNMPPQKQAEWKQAEAAGFPTGPELIGLLQDAE